MRASALDATQILGIVERIPHQFRCEKYPRGCVSTYVRTAWKPEERSGLASAPISIPAGDANTGFLTDPAFEHETFKEQILRLRVQIDFSAYGVWASTPITGHFDRDSSTVGYDALFLCISQYFSNTRARSDEQRRRQDDECTEPEERTRHAPSKTANKRMSAIGTKPTCRPTRRMSVIGG